jgi:hypothetical protein
VIDGRSLLCHNKSLMETALSFASLVDKYLAWCRKHRSPRTVEWYEGHLSGFLAHLAAADSLPVAELKPYHLVGPAKREGR